MQYNDVLQLGNPLRFLLSVGNDVAQVLVVDQTGCIDRGDLEQLVHFFAVEFIRL